MWDTAENNGVLLYVILAEQKKIEIVADRSFADRVMTVDWQRICVEMEEAFAKGSYEVGTLAALDRISAIARLHFPARGDDQNELPNTTALLRTALPLIKNRSAMAALSLTRQRGPIHK